MHINFVYLLENKGTKMAPNDQYHHIYYYGEKLKKVHQN